MPIINRYVTLGTAAASIVAVQDNMPQDVWVHNAESAESTEAFIGDENVDAATGFHIHSGETLQLTLRPGDTLWGISGQGAPELAVLQIQKND